ncbi:enoyl-CoA hydratase/isomerase family protein [Chloroflexota bacterium]
MAYTYEDMVFEKEGGIAIVTMNRPEKLNALSEAVRKGLIQVIREVEQDDDVRVMILTGAGERGFCSGAEPASLGAGRRVAGGDRSYRKGPLSAPVKMLRNMDKLVIAAVNGVAAGAGFGLALACDIRIASENASFINAFVRRGLHAAWGLTYWMPRVVGIANALEVLCTGDKIDAREAQRLGLVSRVVPAADLMKEAKAFAARLAKQPPMAIEFIKRLVYDGLDNNLEAQLRYEIQCGNILSQTEDFQEGINAFKEKREPVFKGE